MLTGTAQSPHTWANSIGWMACSRNLARERETQGERDRVRESERESMTLSAAIRTTGLFPYKVHSLYILRTCIYIRADNLENIQGAYRTDCRFEKEVLGLFNSPALTAKPHSRALLLEIRQKPAAHRPFPKRATSQKPKGKGEGKKGKGVARVPSRQVGRNVWGCN